MPQLLGKANDNKNGIDEEEKPDRKKWARIISMPLRKDSWPTNTDMIMTRKPSENKILARSKEQEKLLSRRKRKFRLHKK